MTQGSDPAYIDIWEKAEQNAAAWMRRWGHGDAEVTRGGSDGGIDVRSSTAVAQVKFEAHQVGTPALQRLVGARGREHHLRLYFFSGVGYARPAIGYADEMDIALFVYDPIGNVTAANPAAAEVLRGSRDVDPVAAPTDGHGEFGPTQARQPSQQMLSAHGGFWTRHWALVPALIFAIGSVGMFGVYFGFIEEGETPMQLWYPILLALICAVFMGLWRLSRWLQDNWPRGATSTAESASTGTPITSDDDD